MRAAAAWLGLLVTAFGGVIACGGGAPPDAGEVALLLERWRESLDLDLPAEVVDQGLARVTVTDGGGDLAREGACVALVARALFATGEEQRALRLLESFPAEDGAAHGQGEVGVALAALLLEEDELERAGALLAGRTDPPEAWLVRGRVLARSGDLAGGARDLATFVELAPLHREAAAAHHLLAQHARASGDAARADEHERRAAELGRWHAYLDARRRQIRESPDEPLPRLGLAALWQQAGEHARARDALLALTARVPSFCRGWSALGDAYRALGEMERARESWTRALACDEGLDEARYNRARLAVIEGRLADARPDLERIADGPRAAEPKLLPAHLELARALMQLGEQPRALERYARYVELGGQEPLAAEPEARR